MVRIETTIHMLDISCKFAFLWFFKRFCTYSYIVVHTWFIWHKISNTILFDICYCAEMLNFEKNSHMLEITCKVAFLRLFKVFSNFLAKLSSN